MRDRDRDSDVVYVYRVCPDRLQEKVEILFRSMSIDSTLDKDRYVLLKLNLSNETESPGTNTSPWFLWAVINAFKKHGFKKFMAIECDASYALKIATKALYNTYIGKVLVKHKIPFIQTENIPINNELPVILEDMQLVNLPVIHTHDIAVMSVAVKNLFGLLPAHRYRYHAILPEKLLELYQRIRCLTLVDGTVSLEGGTPRIGYRIKTDLILGGYDALAVDYVVSKIMGLDGIVPMLELAKQKGLLKPEKVEVRGDFSMTSLPVYNFKTNKGTSTKLHKVVLKLERNPHIKRIMDHPLQSIKYLTGENYISIMTYLIRSYISLIDILSRKKMKGMSLYKDEDWFQYFKAFQREFAHM
jgi:uncharacterized protein (DUF362 family)